MAQKVTVALEDDIDGGPAQETVRFGFDGTEYEIDLTRRTPAPSARSWCLRRVPRSPRHESTFGSRRASRLGALSAVGDYRRVLTRMASCALIFP